MVSIFNIKFKNYTSYSSSQIRRRNAKKYYVKDGKGEKPVGAPKTKAEKPAASKPKKTKPVKKAKK